MTNSGPCSLNKIFTDIDGINGMCQCRDRNQLLFKGDDRCHRIYAKVFFIFYFLNLLMASGMLLSTRLIETPVYTFFFKLCNL